MNILVITTNYPTLEGGIGLMYIHTRNIYYKKNGINVTVLNFACERGYIIDGIQVISISEYNQRDDKYDILVSHAPNLRNHLRFLQRNQKRFKNTVFFFHGHEVLFRSKTYSKPYKYMQDSRIKKLIEDLYDFVKLKIWHHYFKKSAKKSYFVFVSKWMYDEFKKWVHLGSDDLCNHIEITYNSIGKLFEEKKYNSGGKKEYDCITIRGFLDGSKYAIDNVCKIANSNPRLSFLVVGKGKYFTINEKPSNVIWLDRYCNHEQVMSLLNTSKVALMPTRTDAQGLMACEMASFGIPLITSDIPVCHEIFDEFSNVKYISNENPEIDFNSVFSMLEKIAEIDICEKYYAKETTKKEIELLKRLATKSR